MVKRRRKKKEEKKKNATEVSVWMINVMIQSIPTIEFFLISTHASDSGLLLLCLEMVG